MISSSARASRSASRYSSPAQPNGGAVSKPLEVSRSSANEASRTFMQRWLEPSVQSRPSFEEAGLVRGGVLENMAPLGALPKPKKAIGENGMPTRKIILKTSNTHPPKKPARQETSAQDDGPVVGTVSWTVSPPVSSPLFPPAPTDKSKPLAARTKDDEADDEEYDPKGDSRRRRSRRVSLPVKRTMATATATAAATAAAQASIARERRNSTSIVPKPTTPVKHEAPSEPEKKGLTDKVVEAAVDEALKHYRYPTAWALKTLYEEKSGDRDFTAMIQDVFSQTADEETMGEFFKQMEERKRQGKKDNRGCYFFVPPATNSRFTPHKPMAAPYAHLIHEPEELPRESTMQAAKKAKTCYGGTGAGAGAGAGGLGASSTGTPRRKGAGAAAVGTTSRTEKATWTTNTTTTTTTNMIRVKTPASRKRARRDSGSSDSSLSTALSMSSPEVRASSILNSPSALQGPAGRGDARGARGHGARGARGGSVTATGTATGAKSPTAPKSQPITSRAKSVASSKQVVASSSRSNSPILLNTSRTRAHKSCSSVVDDASMPGRVSAAELFPNLKVKHKAPEKSLSVSVSDSAPVSAAKDAEIDVPTSMLEEEEEEQEQEQEQEQQQQQEEREREQQEEDSFWDRRWTARRVTNNLSPHESSLRGPDADHETTPVKTTRRTRQSLAASVTTRATRSASKRPHDDMERTVSPIALSLAGDGSSTVASRAATPTSLRPAKKQKTGLRVKTSPIKKKGGAAGVPRQPHEPNSSSINGIAPKDPNADNDEYCSACGNTGDVVCCDGCPRSFHFECVDMVRSDHLPDEWYCNECLIRRYPSRVPIHKGIFGGALNNLEKSIPRAFSLPKRVQSRFEGVRAGADGDYEEVVSNKTARKRNGTDEPDFFKQREDGQAVLCHCCQKPATQIRSIIPCSLCSFYWHIDCLDPPLAVPPVLKTWRCPAHVDDILIEVPSLAPAHRFRRVKGNQTVTPAFGRGLKNNGHIEIDWTDEPDESDESGWVDYHSFGRTYKLSAKGVVLDFIEQLRNKGAGYGPRQNESRLIPYPTPPAHGDSTSPLPGSALDRKVQEMQVSLNLISLQQHRSHGIDQLTAALLASADDTMLSLMAKGNADNLASGQLVAGDRLSLRAMLAQMDAMSSRIRQVLAEDSSATPAPQPIKAEPSSPVTASTTGLNDPRAEKMDPCMPVTEPTPPSTVDHGEGIMDLD